MRDTGRIKCYRAEWSLGEREQLAWPALLELALRVIADPAVKAAYPRLNARSLKLRPVMQFRKGYIGQYDPQDHRIKLAWGGRDALTLLHEIAHAATSGDKHTVAWREAYIWLVWRFLGEDEGRRLAAAFVNHQALEVDA